jgi:MoaA/NifB/PqqE/SkfB family radical SAM enzyme
MFDTISAQITWRCNIACAHCCQDHLNTDLDISRFVSFIKLYKEKLSLKRIGITGGEPFLRYKELLTLGQRLCELQINWGIVTNAYWAKSYTEALEKLSALNQLGLDVLAVSYDAFHGEFIPIEHLEYGLSAAKKLNISSFVYISSLHREPTTTHEMLALDIAKNYGASVNRRIVVPVAYGEKIQDSACGYSISELSLVCPQRNTLTVWPDGKVLPCCTAGTHESLSLGNIHENSPEEIVDKFANSNFLKPLFSFGFEPLLERLTSNQIQTLKAMKFVSPCHLCYYLCEERTLAKQIAEQNVKPLNDWVDAIFSSSSFYREANVIK